MEHSAVCTGSGTIEMTEDGGPEATQRRSLPGYGEAGGSGGGRGAEPGMVRVPCRSLTSLMAAHGLERGATFLSLDVEGAEAAVLETVEPAVFSVVMVEADGKDLEKEKRVHRMLVAAGLRMHRALSEALSMDRPRSHAYVRPDLLSVAPPPLRAGMIGHNHSHDVFGADGSRLLDGPRGRRKHTVCVKKHCIVIEET